MSEAWAICFVTAVFTALAWGVNRIASKLDEMTSKLNSISESLSSYVKETECDDAMEKHCKRIARLECKVNEHTQQINTLEAKK